MRRLAIALSALAVVTAACAGDGTGSTVAGSGSEANSSTSQAAGALENRGSITEAEVPATTDAPSEPDASATTGASSASGGETPDTSVATEPAPPSDLPDVPLIDLATGAEFSVASLVPSDTPILLWFWAPH